MSAEWKPGTLAMVGCPGVNEQPMTWATNCYTSRHPGFPHWHNTDRNTYLPANAAGITVRPLVVIDPEDRERVERLRVAYHARRRAINGSDPTSDLQAALREDADPRDPKPEEPLGLGAVVEDWDGGRWVRSNPAGEAEWVTVNAGARGLASPYRTYAQINAVRILSDGYEATP